jgi:hypothetical protein
MSYLKRISKSCNFFFYLNHFLSKHSLFIAIYMHINSIFKAFSISSEMALKMLKKLGFFTQFHRSSCWKCIVKVSFLIIFITLTKTYLLG